MKTVEAIGVFWGNRTKDTDGNVIFLGHEETTGLYIYTDRTIKNSNINLLIENFKNNGDIDYYIKSDNSQTVITIKVLNNEFSKWMYFLKSICIALNDYNNNISIWGGGEFCPTLIDSLDIEDEDFYFYFDSENGFMCNSDLNEDYRSLTKQQLSKISKTKKMR